MTIHLSKDLEQIVHNAILGGLYAREDDVIRDALTRLEKTLPKPTGTSDKPAKRARPHRRKRRSRYPSTNSTAR